MRKLFTIILISVVSAFLLGCRKDDIYDLNGTIKIEEYLVAAIPELKNYEEYIKEESEGEAYLIVEVNPSWIEIGEGKYYPVYVGEQWNDHRVNWEWFYVNEQLDEILWYDLTDDEFYLLEEWRNSKKYRTRNELLIDSALKLEPDDFTKKWKVTEIVSVYSQAPTYYIPHFFLGRTLVIGNDELTQSVASPPFDWSEGGFQYTKAELVTVDIGDPWLNDFAYKENLRLLGIDEKVNILRFFQETGGKENCKEVFVVLDEDKLLAMFMGGYYLLEPFAENVTVDFGIEQLFGNWEIIRLDSFDEGYWGSVEDVEEVQKAYNYQNETLNRLVGSEFVPLDWYGESIKIGENILICKNETIMIDTISTEIVSLERFEKDNHIHDGLSLNTEKVEVIWLWHAEEKIPLVIKDDNSFFIHLGQGWFLAERQE